MTDNDSKVPSTGLKGDGIMVAYLAVRDAVVREFVSGASVSDLAKWWSLRDALIQEMIREHMK